MTRQEQVMEALANMLLPYICERTGISRDNVESVLEAEMSFWQAHPNGIRLMFNEDCGGDDGG